MRWYWERYVPQALAAGDYATLARNHHTYRGERLAATLPYWQRVQQAIAGEDGHD